MIRGVNFGRSASHQLAAKRPTLGWASRRGNESLGRALRRVPDAGAERFLWIVTGKLGSTSKPDQSAVGAHSTNALPFGGMELSEGTAVAGSGPFEPGPPVRAGERTRLFGPSRGKVGSTSEPDQPAGSAYSTNSLPFEGREFYEGRLASLREDFPPFERLLGTCLASKGGF